MRPGTYVLLITSPVNAGLNYLFIYPLKFGLYGAPLATGTSYWLSAILLVAYAFSAPSRGRSAWGGFTRATFHLQHLLTFARLALLGTIHIGTEWYVLFFSLHSIYLFDRSSMLDRYLTCDTTPLTFSL